MKAVADIQAGVCGFTTHVEADAEDEMVSFTLTTDCQKVRGLARALADVPVDAYQEIHAGYEGKLLSIVRANLSGCCAGCAVPVGLFKAMQVAAQVALPKDVVISIRKD